ncbi:uncharacterized protein LOC110328354 [Mus pahari]|uniref:uncharacterized protein LOC110328354 n=1 Tax=Mus pahari TaxID=10093 RepID=UPI000A314157|nr:uncharacterized protein LOC110328354 [Mus pahari]
MSVLRPGRRLERPQKPLSPAWQSAPSTHGGAQPRKQRKAEGGERDAREATEEARRARLGTPGEQPPLGSTASSALAHGSAPRGPGRRVAADGVNEAPGLLGPFSPAASPSSCPALPTRLRGPGPLTPSTAAPRRTGRPAGRRLPQRPPGSRGSARLGAGSEGAGPARREGAFKATHTPPSAQNRAREPGGLATLGSGLDWAPAGLEES